MPRRNYHEFRLTYLKTGREVRIIKSPDDGSFYPGEGWNRQFKWERHKAAAIAALTTDGGPFRFDGIVYVTGPWPPRHLPHIGRRLH